MSDEIQPTSETVVPASTESFGVAKETPTAEPAPIEPTPGPAMESPAPVNDAPIEPVPAEPVQPVPAQTQMANDNSMTNGINPNMQAKSLLARALEVIRFRKRAKLEKIVQFTTKHGSVTNDQVEKLLHVSDATASRYLAELTKQGRLRKTGTTSGTRYEPVGSIPTI